MLGFAPSNLQATSGMNAMGGTVPVPYDLLDEFITADASPVTSPRTAEPDPGTLTLVVTDGTFAIAGADLDFTAQSTPVWGDHGFHAGAVTRVVGTLLMIDINLSTWEECGLGWHTAAAVVDPDSAEHAIQANTTDGRLDLQDGVQIYAGLSTSTAYKLAIVLRTTGAFYYLHDGTDWVLMYVWGASGATATLYPMFANLDGAGTLDNLRVLSLPYTPTPLAYDTFTRDDSDSLGSTETTGPDGQGCIARAWTESNGDWDISSNAMVPAGSSPGGAGWLVSHDVGEADAYCEMSFNLPAGANTAGMLARYIDNDNLWQPQAKQSTSAFSLWERTSGSWGQRASTTATVTADTTQTIKWTATGDVHKCWLNDGDYLTYTDSSSNTGTGYGCRHSGTSVKTEDITVWPVNPPDFPSV